MKNFIVAMVINTNVKEIWGLKQEVQKNKTKILIMEKQIETKNN